MIRKTMEYKTEEGMLCISRLSFLAAALAAALLFTLCLPRAMVAYASPEFARSGEEWAALSDNRLEWGEIPGLVNEYNATVLNNQRAYQKDSGQDAQEIRDSLLDAADDMDSLAAEADGTAGMGMLAANYRSQAEQLRTQAENSVSDSDIIRWQYQQVEANIVQTVQNTFIGYYQSIAEKAQAEAGLPYLEQALASAENRFNVGAGTRIEVLTAQENLQNAKAALLSSDARISSYQKQLQVLCGWKYDAEAEIGPLPDYDMAEIGSIDLAADTEKALEGSFQLRIDQRKLENAPDSTLREQYQKTVNTDQQQIRASVKSAYDALVLAKSDYDTAVSQEALKQQTLEKSKRQYELGTISRMEYAAAENDAVSAAHAAELKKLAVFSAKTAYDNAVLNGLAQTGSGS